VRRVLSLLLILCFITVSFVGCRPKQTEAIVNIAEADLTLAPEELLAKYEFRFFSTLKGAVAAANADEVLKMADADRQTAAVAVYDGGDAPYLILLNDHSETEGIMWSCSATLNLGGKKLHFTNRKLAFEIDPNYVETVVIDGRLNGSEIVVDGSEMAAGIFRTGNGTLKVLGGKYVARAESRTANVKCFLVDEGGKLYMSDCDIDAHSHYLHDGEQGYASLSMGVDNKGFAELTECEVFGTHSAMQTSGTVKINGGVYESVGHGGFYFCGLNSVSLVKNAVIKQGVMPEGFEQTVGGNRAGFYIGGGEGDDHNSVYMDNCTIIAEKQPIVLRGSSGEQGNTLYISNSSITADTELGVRVDNNTHRLFLGVGNTFGIEEVKLRPGITEDDLKIMVTVTDEVYSQDR